TLTDTFPPGTRIVRRRPGSTVDERQWACGRAPEGRQGPADRRRGRRRGRGGGDPATACRVDALRGLERARRFRSRLGGLLAPHAASRSAGSPWMAAERPSRLTPPDRTPFPTELEASFPIRAKRPPPMPETPGATARSGERGRDRPGRPIPRTFSGDVPAGRWGGMGDIAAIPDR